MEIGGAAGWTTGGRGRQHGRWPQALAANAAELGGRLIIQVAFRTFHSCEPPLLRA